MSVLRRQQVRQTYLKAKSAWKYRPPQWYTRLGYDFLKALLLLLVLSGVLYGVLTVFLDPFLERKLKAAVLQGSDSTYALELDDVHYNFYRNALIAEGIRLRPTPKLDSFRTRYPDSVGLRYDLTVPSLRIARFSWWELLRKEGVHIKRISVEQPRLTLFARQPKKVPLAEKKKKDLPATEAAEDSTATGLAALPLQLRKVMPWLHIDTIVIQEGSFRYLNRAGMKDTTGHRLDHFWIYFRDVHIDSAAALDPQRIFFTRDIRLQIQKYRRETIDRKYLLTVDTLTYSTAARRLQMDGVSYRPPMSDAAFTKLQRFQDDRFRLSVRRVKLERLNLDSLLKGNS